MTSWKRLSKRLSGLYLSDGARETVDPSRLRRVPQTHAIILDGTMSRLMPV
jgi:hypothetical protein